MRITVEDTSLVNWDSVLERVTAECTKRATEVVMAAQRTLSELEPGARKTLTVKVGSITIARPK